MDSAVWLSGGWLRVMLIACVGCLAYSAALADSPVQDRFTLTARNYKPSIDTQVRFDSSDLILGSNLDLEDDLQVDKSDTLTKYDARFRITSQISVEIGYFELGRFADTVLTDSIQFGDTVFPTSADVTTHFKADVATLGLSWAFVRSDSVEVSASAGAYWMSLETGIAAIGGGSTELAKADSMLPMAGLSLGWNLMPNVQLMVSGDYLSIDDDDLDGNIATYRAGLGYQLLENMGIGVGYDVLDFNVESTNSGFSGLVNYRQQGPTVFLSLRF